MANTPRRKEVDLGLAYELASEIKNADTREACKFLIKYSESLVGWECGAARKGYLNDFRFYTPTEWPFAFIINKTSLLWYFRHAGLRSPAADVTCLRREFKDVRERSTGEIKVRLADVRDAKKIVSLVFERDHLGRGV